MGFQMQIRAEDNWERFGSRVSRGPQSPAVQNQPLPLQRAFLFWSESCHFWVHNQDLIIVHHVLPMWKLSGLAFKLYSGNKVSFGGKIGPHDLMHGLELRVPHAPVVSSMETEVPPVKCSTPLFLPLPLWIVTFLPLFLPLFSPRQVSSSSWCPFRPQGREHSPDHEGIHRTKKWADQAWWLPCVSGLCSLQTQGLSFFLKHSDETYHSEFSYVDT